MSPYVAYAIGFTAQLLFSARLLSQWILSEKAGRTLSPLIFWQLSVLASFLFMVYGIFRDDLAIIFSQSIGYAIYIRNLHFQGHWRTIPRIVRLLIIVFPILAAGWLAHGPTNNLSTVLNNPDIPAPLMAWGLFGQSVFTFRFVYQLLVMEKKKESILSLGFWLLSITGSLMVLSYAILRRDPVLFIGQLFGSIVYGRNIILCRRQGPVRQAK
ncbi:MAG: lipid-A-disaccharide synthase N-terminal domain-containing protein [Desulfopila sp.]